MRALFLSISLSMSLLASAATRVAILSDAGNVALADRLTAELSSQDQIELLERAEIGKILAESKLAVEDIKENPAAGKILGVDGILILETAESEKNSTLRARLVATQPGIAIASGFFPAGAPDLAVALADRFKPVWQKLAVARGNAIPVSLLNIRSQIRGSEVVESQITWLLANQLVQRREVFVLERWKMDDLTLEKSLSSDAEDFWTGGYIVDGKIKALAGDGLEVTVSLRAPDGRESERLEAVGTSADLDAITKQLAHDLINKLPKTTNLRNWDPLLESSQFFREAEWAYGTRLFREAHSAAEASYALGNRDAALSLLRVRINAALAFPQTESFRDSRITGFQRYDISPESLPARINSAMTALSLAAEMTPVDAKDIGEEALSCSISAILSASRILRKHWSVNSGIDTPGIQELRSLTRSLAERITSLGKSHRPDEMRLFHITRAIYIPYWHDVPEEAVEAWSRLLGERFEDDSHQGETFAGIRRQIIERREADFREASGTPWLIGWKGQSAGDLDALWLRFIGSLEKSGDVREKVDGSLLRFGLTKGDRRHPNRRPDTEEEIGIREVLWAGRDYLLGNDLAHIYLGVLIFSPGNKFLDGGQIRQWLAYCLREAKEPNWAVIATLWRTDQMDAEGAEEIYPLLKAYRARFPEKEADVSQRERYLMDRFPEVDGSREPLATPNAKEPLVVTRSWFPPELVEGKKNERATRHGMIGSPDGGAPAISGTNIWMPIIFRNYSADDIIGNSRIYKLDRKTFKVLDTIDTPIVPENIVRPGDERIVGSGQIHLTDTSLFLEMRKGIQHMNLKTGAWRVLPLPARFYSAILAVGDDVYAGFSPGGNEGESGIIHYSATSNSCHVLASNRSQPLTGPLAGEASSLEELFEIEPGKLGAVIWKSTDHIAYSYDKADGTWEKILPKGSEVYVFRTNGDSVLRSEQSGIAVAREGKPLLTLFGSNYEPTGKSAGIPEFLSKKVEPTSWMRANMVYGDEKLWVTRRIEHPQLGAQSILTRYDENGASVAIPLRFEMPPEVSAAGKGIQRIPAPALLDETCVRISWFYADETGLTFFTGNAGDRTYPGGLWFLPTASIEEWISQHPED